MNSRSFSTFDYRCYLSLIVVVSISIIVGFYYWPSTCLWLFTSLTVNWLIATWHSYLILVLWLLGLSLDLFTGSALGLGGCWLLLQILIAKILLASHAKLRICWLIVSSLGWSWLSHSIMMAENGSFFLQITKYLIGFMLVGCYLLERTKED